MSPELRKSEFGSRMTARSGIGDLMEDLGHALAEGGAGMRMLGGGNPAIVPEVAACWRRRMAELLEHPDAFDRMLAIYDPPKGNGRFALALAAFLQREYGWDVGAEHIAITGGGQTAFFYLFNLLAGRFADGRNRNVILPVVPEYIGYADQSADGPIFKAIGPDIEFLGKHDFKYRVDFSRLEASLDAGAPPGAICVSRPTNPSGNVLTDGEMDHLDAIARSADVPLIVDSAYGAPFPGILFRDVTPRWNENVIYTMSLSKLGLPGTRTGIVVARPEITRAIAAMTAITGLANGTIGQALVTPLLESGEIKDLVSGSIRPFYERKATDARRWIAEAFDDGIDYLVHSNEGALFLWVWFRGLRCDSAELYRRLKSRGVLVVPGHFFAFGEGADHAHAGQCARINYAMDDATVREGIEIIADEVAKLSS